MNEAMLHPDDADLIRWMDGALAADERLGLEAHAGTCPVCAARRAVLERRAARLSALLRTTDIPAPSTPLRVTIATRAPGLPSWWRMAAVVALAIAGAAVPPLRAWIAEVARTAWTVVTGSRPAEQTPRPSVVAFVPTGPTLTIRIPARPNGALTVEVVAGEQVTMVGAGGQELPGVTVFPDQMVVAEDADSAASYVIRVPARLRNVRILVGQNREEVFRPSTPGERRTFFLR